MRIAERTDGFVYVVSRLGVTGARREPDVAWIAARTAAMRERSDVPLAVGFGISTPAHVRAIAPLADGIIIGSALIDVTQGGTDPRDTAGRAHEYLVPIVAAAVR